MKLIFDKSCIKNVVSLLSPIVKNGFESVPKILFSVEDKVSAYATNGESYIKIVFNCEIEGKGDFIIPGENFIDIIGIIENEKIELSLTEDNKLHIVDGEVDYKIALMETEKEHMLAPDIDQAKSFTIKSQELCNAISAVSCCIDAAKANLNCILIHSDEKEKNKIYVVTTDCMRLGITEIKAKNNDVIPNLLIPKKSAEYIEKIKDSCQENLTIKYTENLIQFSSSTSNNEIYYTSRLMDGSFPKYQSVIPENKKVLEVKTEDFKTTIKRLTAISSNNFRIEMIINSNKIDLSCNDRTTGDSSKTSIEATFSDKKEVKIVCNYKLLLDILEKISSNIIRFQITDGNTPMIIRSVDNENIKYIFMPLVES